MFIEMVEWLRCPRPHALTWLVASPRAMRERHILYGELGCPACGARYPVESAVADFRDAGAAPVPLEVTDATASQAERDPIRCAALLDLVEPGGFVVLAGGWTAAALPLSFVLDGVHVLALNPPPEVGSGERVSRLRATATIPVRPSSCRGVALDAAHASATVLAAAAEVVRGGGRLVAPALAPIPPGFRELARDGAHWVSAREVEETVVQLSRALPFRG